MVRTLPHATPLSGIDPKRIAGNTGVVLLHALVFALLMMPGGWDPPAKPEQTTIVDVVPPERVLPPPPPPPPPEQVQIRERPVQRDPPQVIREELPPVDIAPVFETGEIAAEPVADAGPPVESFDPGPQLATLTYAHNPAPRYPPRSIRAGDEGQVLLRVLVDANGNPIDVTIERSSGHRELDRAAREQVLAKWKFHPAQRAGVPVPAYALVPIDFVLP